MQYAMPFIDANTDTGQDLVDYLNQWQPAVISQHAGASRPSYAVEGMIWVDTSGADKVIYFYDGTSDFEIGRYSASGGGFVIGGGGVIGPASATDNGVVRYDGTTGKLVQDSIVTITDAGSINATTLSRPTYNTYLASTAFVKNFGHSFGGYGLIGADTQLTYAAIGQWFLNTAAGVTATLPSAADAEMFSGATISFFARSDFTIAGNGADLIQQNKASGVVQTNTMTLKAGQSVELVRYSTALWIVAGGSITAEWTLNAPPTTGVDNQAVRFDGTTGRLQGSSVYIYDNAEIIAATSAAQNNYFRQYNSGGGYQMYADTSGNLSIQTVTATGASVRNALYITSNAQVDINYSTGLRFRTWTNGCFIYSDTTGNHHYIGGGSSYTIHTYYNTLGSWQYYFGGSFMQFRQLTAVGAYEKLWAQFNRDAGSVWYYNGNAMLNIGGAAVTSYGNLIADVAGTGIPFVGASNDTTTVAIRAGDAAVYLTSAPGNTVFNYNYLIGYLSNGSTQLNYGNAARLQTSNTGATIFGSSASGAGPRIEAWANAADAQVFITNTSGSSILATIGTAFYLRQGTTANTPEKEWLIAHRDNWLGLYFNGALKFRTDNFGTYTYGKALTSQAASENFTNPDELVSKRYVDSVAATLGGINDTQGYRYLPGGILMQWGVGLTPVSGDATILFKTTFTTCYSVVCAPTPMGGFDVAFSISDITQTSFKFSGSVPTIGANACYVFFIAIGV